MKREENVEVGVEPLGIVAQANANIVLAAQLPLAAANLLSEVRASRREQLVPGCAAEAEHRAAGAPQDLRPEKRRPSFSRRHVLAEEEVESLLSAPVVSDPLGNRDRAMLEVLYATGLRVSELVNLRHGQVNINQGVIRILGKGNRERLIPLGEEAMRWLTEFASGARSEIPSAVAALHGGCEWQGDGEGEREADTGWSEGAEAGCAAAGFDVEDASGRFVAAGEEVRASRQRETALDGGAWFSLAVLEQFS